MSHYNKTKTKPKANPAVEFQVSPPKKKGKVTPLPKKVAVRPYPIGTVVRVNNSNHMGFIFNNKEGQPNPYTIRFINPKTGITRLGGYYKRKEITPVDEKEYTFRIFRVSSDILVVARKKAKTIYNSYTEKDVVVSLIKSIISHIDSNKGEKWINISDYNTGVSGRNKKSFKIGCQKISTEKVREMLKFIG